MKTNLIETLNIKRQRFLLLQTVGLFLFVPSVFIGPFTSGTVWNTIWMCMIVPGLLLFLYATYKTKAIQAAIKSNPELREALNNEYYLICDYKAVAWGYYAMIGVMIVLYIIVGYVEIPARIILGIIIFTGILTVKVTQLVLKRN